MSSHLTIYWTAEASFRSSPWISLRARFWWAGFESPLRRLTYDNYRWDTSNHWSITVDWPRLFLALKLTFFSFNISLPKSRFECIIPLVDSHWEPATIQWSQINISNRKKYHPYYTHFLGRYNWHKISGCNTSIPSVSTQTNGRHSISTDTNDKHQPWWDREI